MNAMTKTLIKEDSTIFCYSLLIQLNGPYIEKCLPYSRKAPDY